MMELLGVARCYPRRHWLHALALAGQDQAFEVERCPAPLRLAPQPRQERRQPTLDLTLPAPDRRRFHRAPPPRPSSRQELSAKHKVAG